MKKFIIPALIAIAVIGTTVYATQQKTASVKVHGSQRQKLPKLKERFISQSAMLYDAAVQNRKFTGGDIWSFFRDNLESYRIEGSEARPVRNILVVLTDGYINFAKTSGRPREGNKASWMEVSGKRHNGWEEEFAEQKCGLLPAGKDHGNWEVLVLEVDPKSAQDLPIIRKYWSTWFDDMGISHYRIEKENDSSALTKDVIATFIKESPYSEKEKVAKR